MRRGGQATAPRLRRKLTAARARRRRASRRRPGRACGGVNAGKINEMWHAASLSSAMASLKYVDGKATAPLSEHRNWESCCKSRRRHMRSLFPARKSSSHAHGEPWQVWPRGYAQPACVPDQLPAAITAAFSMLAWRAVPASGVFESGEGHFALLWLCRGIQRISSSGGDAAAVARRWRRGGRNDDDVGSLIVAERPAILLLAVIMALAYARVCGNEMQRRRAS